MTSHSHVSRASLGVFPWYYHAFFTLVEPALTLGGAAWAIFSPDDYHRELIPVAVAAKPSLIHPSSVMAVRQLGSCFFLLALLASLMLRKICTALRNHPAQLEQIVYSYLLCLALADWTHIGFTLYDLGLEASLKPFSHWNTLVFGNVVITTGLFVVRAMWFAGIRRASAKNQAATGSSKKWL